ncbi:hypothetical protein [Shigella dysenteriae]|uniref:hypothetical protein n=1 Tax=Shigella dysenteriae TaxID=622 RepID=UPI000CF684AE|nr:hypothetical protein [Shigella dysenteriae]
MDWQKCSGIKRSYLASSNQVSELTMWVKRLVSQLKKAKPDCKLPEKAMDYLKRNGLISVEDVLR